MHQNLIFDFSGPARDGRVGRCTPWGYLGERMKGIWNERYVRGQCRLSVPLLCCIFWLFDGNWGINGQIMKNQRNEYEFTKRYKITWSLEMCPSEV